MEKEFIVQNSHNSIENQISSYIKTDSFKAFSEYIWNSIDSRSTKINIDIVEKSEILKKLEITDNGSGISYEKLNSETFGVFNDSRKILEVEKNHSLPHGKRGFGRFAFKFFALEASWKTVYKKGDKKYEYSILINSNKLNKFESTNPELSNSDVGTKVIFKLFNDRKSSLLNYKNKNDLLDKFKDYIISEFAWAIILLNIEIKINGVLLDLSTIIEDVEDSIFKIGNYDYNIKFIKWAKKLNSEYSRYYFLDDKKNEKYTKTTTLNNKGDNFYHSVYISSPFFDVYNFSKENKDLDKNQKTLLNELDKIYDELIEKVDNYLLEKRKPYIKVFSEKKVKELESEGNFPKFRSEFEAKAKKPIFVAVTREIIEFAPSLFTRNNNNQKKIILNLINQLLDDESSRNTLLNIIGVLVDDSNKNELIHLEQMLKNYGLKNIVGTIKLVEDRIRTLETLKEMVYSDNIYFLESDLQKIIEEHFWIFGDEYNFMIASEEDDFTKLRNIYYDKVLKISKDEYEQHKISRKQVDLFISGLVSEGKSIKNLIVEIKRPSKPIGMEEYKQIETYSEIIKNESQFNGFNYNWDFLLIGKDFSDDYIPDLYIDQSRGLVKEIKNKNIRIFCLRWIDLLEGVKFRLDFLKNKLEVKKSHLGLIETKEKEVFLEQFENSAKILEVKSKS